MRPDFNSKLRAIFLVTLIGLSFSSPICAAQSFAEAPRQILVNPDFSLPLVMDNPPGWFRAMMPRITDDLKAGVGKDEKGPYLYLEQKRVKGQLFNNWAQRVEKPQIGQTMQLETEVATENVEGKGAAILIMFFDAEGKIVGGASSEENYDLTGTKSWTKINLKATVPPECDLAIIRLGLRAGAGRIMVRYARLYLLNNDQVLSSPAVSKSDSQEWTAGLELLANGDFENTVILGSPVGWFRAMMPDKAVNHKAGVEKILGRGKAVFIEQDGVKMSLVNNWAQRLDIIPIGARLQLTAEVKTEKLPENTGFVMIQCWGTKDRLLAAANSQSSEPIGGTEDWKSVSIEVMVPEQTNTIIVRCGLAQSGKIWFDNVSLKIISPGISQQANPSASRREGFQVTDESVKQLQKLTALSEELMEISRQKLGENVKLRKEIFAQGNGKFQIVLLLNLSMDED